MNLHDFKKQKREEFENLKCVNGAMYFGCPKSPCRGECCPNEQSLEEAEAEYTVFLDTSYDELLALVEREVKDAKYEYPPTGYDCSHCEVEAWKNGERDTKDAIDEAFARLRGESNDTSV